MVSDKPNVASFAAVLWNDSVETSAEDGTAPWLSNWPLVAKLGAALLCVDLELALEPRQDHASYIANWLTVLRNDNRAIFTAASHAQQAAAHLAAAQAPPYRPAPCPHARGPNAPPLDPLTCRMCGTPGTSSVFLSPPNWTKRRMGTPIRNSASGEILN